MAGPLLETKLHAPTRLGGLVARPRLVERLLEGTCGTLTLVSAPAGFGKSTLMAELASEPSRPTAWLSLDEGDDDPATFWGYAFGALDRIIAGLGGAAASALDGGAPDAAMAAVINALSAEAGDVVLVLDDLHVIGSTEIHRQLAWFLDHLPANAHVVVGTRADPPMPLARLRARGALTEIRAADLRFSPDEAADYLNAVMQLDLTAGDVNALEARTEGWIAALQLAALSLRGRADPSAFIAAFAGDDRYVVDYLVEEVLRRQAPEVREFLLETSILARLTAPLVDAVTGRDDGRAMLESLDRGNLFLVPLDDRRRWYRYHQLFAGVLQAHLADERADDLARLHGLAGAWFEGQGELEEAIRHAFEADDMERAADLLEQAAPAMGRARREATLARLLDRLPRRVIERRPVLLLEQVGALLSIHEAERVPALLEAVEGLLASGAALDNEGGVIVVDRAAFERVPGMLALYQAAFAKLAGDMPAHVAKAQRVLEVAREDDHLARGGAESLLGLAQWEAGELEDAYRWYASGMSRLEQGGRIADLVSGEITKADIRLAQGRLRDALAEYEAGLELATRGGGPLLRGVADMHVGIGDIRYERNDLAGAEASLAESRRLGDALGFPKHPYRSRLLEARLLQARGDVDGAIRAFDEADRRYVGDFSPDTRPVPAQRAAVQVAHGRLADAGRWAEERSLRLDGPISYLGEYELLTLARLVVARARAGEADADLAAARELLDRLLAAAEAGDRAGSVLEIRIVQALGAHAAGDEGAAPTALSAAIAIAESQGYVRTFLDEGPAMMVLLRLALKRRGASGYAAGLLAAATGERDRRAAAASPSMVEPLSERELEVLRLLRSELSGPEMAHELVVSLNTLRTHTKNIYAKLGVTSRLAALRRAEELGLL